MDNPPVIVLDFETTGLSPRYGDRPIEIGAALVENGMIKGRFQSLMNPGFRFSSFIENFTGISNEMVAKAPPCEEVMARFAEFIADFPLVAHNASFDRRFLETEFASIGMEHTAGMACSMLAARRIFPEAPNHRLATLARHCGIISSGTFHRALADAEMTARLWIAMTEEVRDAFGIAPVSFGLMQKIAALPKAKIPAFLSGIASGRE
jgi:DNA polymerase-3 subunit epsilon